MPPSSLTHSQWLSCSLTHSQCQSQRKVFFCFHQIWDRINHMLTPRNRGSEWATARVLLNISIYSVQTCHFCIWWVMDRMRIHLLCVCGQFTIKNSMFKPYNVVMDDVNGGAKCGWSFKQIQMWIINYVKFWCRDVDAWTQKLSFSLTHKTWTNYKMTKYSVWTLSIDAVSIWAHLSARTDCVVNGTFLFKFICRIR